ANFTAGGAKHSECPREAGASVLVKTVRECESTNRTRVAGNRDESGGCRGKDTELISQWGRWLHRVVRCGSSVLVEAVPHIANRSVSDCNATGFDPNNRPAPTVRLDRLTRKNRHCLRLYQHFSILNPPITRPQLLTNITCRIRPVCKNA